MGDQAKARRKELTREYKRTPKDMGVYIIRNAVNGKCFVGPSADVRSRLNRHRMDLRTNSERNSDLQHDWNSFGADAFEFEVVDLLEPAVGPGYDPAEDLQVLESLWVEKLQPFNAKGYNRR